jgi:hypothetical protein
MKRLILGMGIVLGVALSATVSLAQQCTSAAGCNTLCVAVNPDIGWMLNTDITTSCLHGDPLVAVTPTLAILAPDEGFYGPDCRLGFVNPTTGTLSIMEFQQDYCFLEAGQITVSHIQGPALQYTVIPGNANGRIGGAVIITGGSATQP